MLSNTFISAGNEFSTYDNHIAAPLFRRTFTIAQKPKNASFTICGLGLYELYLNGERITNGEIAPYINNPNDILFYDKYDLTDKLLVGENVIGIMLGNGFFNCIGGFMWDFDKAEWRGPLRVAFSMEIDNTLMFEADESVKVASSPVTFNDLRIGSFYDARLEISGWNNINFDDSDWKNAIFATAPKGEARIRTAEPIVIYGERKPVSIKHMDDFCFCCKKNNVYCDEIEQTRVKDTYIYDFGINDAGVCRLKIKGKAGQTIKLRFGEMMVDGRFSIRSTIFIREDNEETKRYFDYPQMDIYVCKGEGEEIYIPPFTYHGFRYVLVEGITPEQATNDLLTYLVMSSDIKERSDFSCSNEVLNKLFSMTRRSDRSNFFFFPTDCPHREKNGWTGDASLSAEHILIHMEATNSFKEWLRCVAKAQRESGELPGIVPTAGWGFDWGNGPIWDSVSVNLPFYSFRFDGEKDIITENKDMILSYLRYAAAQRDQDGLIAIGLDDWCQVKLVYDDPASPLRFTDTVTVLDMAIKAHKLFNVIGFTEGAEYALTLARELRSAIRENLIDFETMTVEGECQTSQAVALALDIFEEDEKPAALNVLIDTIKFSFDHLNAGILGGRYIFHILIENGYADLAYKMIARTDAPSYGAWVAEGSTTLCEHFSADGVHRSSQNHHFWGDILSIFIQEFAGIKPNPFLRDVNEFEISPVFVKDLSWASASYNTKYGKVAVKWEREGASIRLEISAPCECYGLIKLPNGYTFSNNSSNCEIKSGIYYVNV